jgi:hypothetical protein
MVKALRCSVGVSLVLCVACSAMTEPEAAGRTSAAVTALRQQCDATRGEADPVLTKEDLAPRLAGRWYFCPGFGKAEQEPLADEEAIEISADGRWWWLASDATGTFSRRAGIENTGTWDQDGARDDQPSLIYLRLWNAAMFWLNLGFEQSPRRVLGTYFSQNPVHMVPIED